MPPVVPSRTSGARMQQSPGKIPLGMGFTGQIGILRFQGTWSKLVGCTRRANNGGRHGDRLLPDYVAALACAQQNNANLGLIQLY
jgi:hypothetical protein